MTIDNLLTEHLLRSLCDPDADVDDVKLRLGSLCRDDSPEAGQLFDAILARIRKDGGKKDYVKKSKQLAEMMEALNNGPLRTGAFLAVLEGINGSTVDRAEVLLENGDTAYPVAADPKLLKNLRCGDTVLLDAQARVVLNRCTSGTVTGEVAELSRRIDDDRVELVRDDHFCEVYRVSGRLKELLAGGSVEAGSKLVVCSRRRIAFEALPCADGLSQYRFLEQGPVPNVIASRDIGCPSPYIDELTDHIRDAMLRPELDRKYRIRPMQTRLLEGPTGTGKTLSILALIRAAYEVISEITGAPIDQLPPRVLRLRTPNYLSKWLGESDKLLNRFFDEAIQLADAPFTWQGKEYKLPVICRGEEIDALARARDGSDDVHGRILTTPLERLDHLADDLGDKLIIFLFTTNTAELCDTAFLRRAGGEIISFGRVRRSQFRAILAKQIRGLPLGDAAGQSQEQTEKAICRRTTNWLFSPNGHDRGQVELTFAGSSTPVIKYRRDLLTGAVIDASVQQACKEAKRNETGGSKSPGLTTEILLDAIDAQIRGICQQITAYNTHRYLALPDGVRVANVRRIDQPALQPYELERME